MPPALLAFALINPGRAGSGPLTRRADSPPIEDTDDRGEEAFEREPSGVLIDVDDGPASGVCPSVIDEFLPPIEPEDE
jgi:hypothetical protein